MEEDQFFMNGDSTNIFKLVINKYLPFWPLFVLTAGVALVIAFFKLRTTDPEYIVSSRIMIKDPAKGAGGDENTRILEDMDIFRSRKSLDNEIVTLKSTGLITRAAKELDIYARIFNKGNVRTEELYGDNSPLRFVATDKDHFSLWKTLFFDMDWENGRIFIDGQKVSFDDTLWIGGQGLTMEINSRYNTSARGKKFFVVFSDAASVAAGFGGAMSLKPYSFSSSILDVTVKTTAPAKTKDLLLKIFDIYNKEAVIDKNLAANRTIDFIDERLELVTLQLDSVEKNISQYKLRADVIDLDNQASDYFRTVSELDGAIARFDLQLAALKDLEKQMDIETRNTGALPSLSLIDDGLLAGLFGRLSDSEIELTKLKSITGEKNEATILAQSNVNNLKVNIGENIKGLRNNILLSKSKVQDRIDQNNILLQSIPEKERMFLDISRQQSVKNNIYTFLLQKKEETAIAAIATGPDLRIMEAPASRGPVAPLPGKFYTTAFIAGLLAAGALVPIREVLNKKVLFRSEIEKKIMAPIIGELMQNPSKSEFLVIDGKNRSVIAEQFRMIRTNLSFLGMDKVKNVVIVTSGISDEGKSFVSANLALSLTLMDHSVALLEFDLRQPGLSKKLGFSHADGISAYLTGRAGLDDIIRKTSYENLSFIPAGVKPPNPAELISGGRFPQLIQELKKKFDYIIMDTAPVAPVSDTFLMSEQSDITLFVVRHKVTPRALLESIEKIYENERFRNMAVVFNGVKPRGIQFLGYNVAGYGNGYGAAYGYGNDYAGKYGAGYYSDGVPGPGLWKSIRELFKKDNKLKS